MFLAIAILASSAACEAICAAVTSSLLSITVRLLASLSSSILFTKLVMRSVFSMMRELMSFFVVSSNVTPGSVTSCVKPDRIFSGVRISWEICWIKFVFIFDDSSARALATFSSSCSCLNFTAALCLKYMVSKSAKSSTTAIPMRKRERSN